MPDKYDEAMTALLDGPAETFQQRVLDAWTWGEGQSPLFAGAGPTGSEEDGCACLTQVRAGLAAFTPALSDAIRADERLPDDPRAITPEMLPVFAEWQRRIDKELQRT